MEWNIQPLFAPPFGPSVKQSTSKIDCCTFLLTVNTNQVYTRLSHNEQEKYKDFFKWLIEKDRFINYFVEYVPRVEDNYLFDQSEPVHGHLLAAAVQGYPEVGGKQGRLHVHAVVKIVAEKQEGKSILINSNKIRSLFKDTFKFDAHINVKKISDQSVRMSYYAQKNKPKEEIKL